MTQWLASESSPTLLSITPLAVRKSRPARFPVFRADKLAPHKKGENSGQQFDNAFG